MNLQLTKQDWGVILGGLIVSIIAGGILQVLWPNPTIDDVIFVELIASLVTVIIILGGLVAILKVADSWGGDMARGLQIVAAGTIYEMIIFVPHVHWHLISEKLAIDGGSPVAGWLSLHGMWWTGFFHILTAMGFLIIGYGFVVMYKVVKPDLESLE